MNPDLQRSKARVALLSVVSNFSLVLLKLVVGLMIGSVSVISEAIHSGVDLMAALIAWFAVNHSGKPADETHPFGHGKVENISGVVEALLIFFAAGWIIFEAAQKLVHREPLEAPFWGIVIMFISAAANTWVSASLFKVGRATESAALVADAWHLRTDVYTSAGVMVGLIIIGVGKILAPHANLDWIDPVAAMAVALLIFKAAYDLTIEAGKDLLDTKLPPAEEQNISESLALFGPTVHGLHRLRTRKSGQHRFVEFHIRVEPLMTVEQSHQITHQIADAIRRKYPHTSVNIHVEPCHGACSPECAARQPKA